MTSIPQELQEVIAAAKADYLVQEDSYEMARAETNQAFRFSHRNTLHLGRARDRERGLLP